ncbi:hypothetical protein DH2020_016487 [Rehmannia glutinosa]|uniref:Polygalacturonase n=1 Tax=Rehmannia glutinosa TaxID=99300 RepID=A0ABR0WRK6_REHGL
MVAILVDKVCFTTVSTLANRKDTSRLEALAVKDYNKRERCGLFSGIFEGMESSLSGSGQLHYSTCCFGTDKADIPFEPINIQWPMQILSYLYAGEVARTQPKKDSAGDMAALIQRRLRSTVWMKDYVSNSCSILVPPPNEPSPPIDLAVHTILSLHFCVSGNIVAPLKTSWSGKQINAWIIFSNVNGLVMKGNGVIDGQGSSWWPANPCKDDPANGVNCKGPTGMIFQSCHGLRLDGFSKINGPGSHILIMATNDVVASNLRIIAPGDSPNTDAFNISSSTRVQIRNSFIATGDDCIRISAGSSNIDVSGITCGPGHGISIGPLGGLAMVENVRVRNCTLKETQTGLRIKTNWDARGYARNISFEGIKMVAVDNPIQIEKYYCILRYNCPNYTMEVSDVSFTGISGTSVASNVINLSCGQIAGCTNIKLNRVYIASSTSGNNVYASCVNAQGKATHTKPRVDCLLS